MPQPVSERIARYVVKAGWPALAALLALLVAWPPAAIAQPEAQEGPPQVERANPDPLPTPGNPSVPTISFHWVTLGDAPQDFSLTVESTGRAALEIADRSASDDTPRGTPFRARFTMPEADREQVFRLAASVNFFNGNFDYTKTRIANTGDKTLGYADAGRRFSTTYNWSENKAIQELTAFLTGIYWTEYYGRRLDQQQRYDKLGLNDTLSAMVRAAERGDLTQLQIIAPVLQRIAEDGEVMNIARMRARRLLQRIPAAFQGGSQAP